MLVILRKILPWSLAATWWLLDRIWGDRFFDWLKPMIPDAITNLPIRYVFTYGPPIVLIAIGIFLATRKPRLPSVPSIAHSDESVSLREVMYWIDEKSAWGRWQKAMHSWLVHEPERQMTRWFWISEIDRQAQDGKLKIDARRNNLIEREKIERDFWDIACLDAVPNDNSIWRITVRPKDGLTNAMVNKIKKLDYVDLRAKWSEVRDIWPEQNKLLDKLTRRITHKNIDRNKRLIGVLAASLLLIVSAALWRVYFAPIERSLGIEDALIRPYSRDPSLLEIGLEFKNISAQPVKYRVKDFVISVGRSERLSLARHGDLSTLLPSMGMMLWFSPFSEGPNEEKKEFANFSVVIEYGGMSEVIERTMTLKFSCDLLLGKKASTDCMIEKEADDENL